jgi:chloramphenicol 3-O-phosphotransferase
VAGTLGYMLTDTADTVEATPVSAVGTPVVLEDVTKRYGRRREPALAAG